VLAVLLLVAGIAVWLLRLKGAREAGEHGDELRKRSAAPLLERTCSLMPALAGRDAGTVSQLIARVFDRQVVERCEADEWPSSTCRSNG
jgi:hypothetical protein